MYVCASITAVGRLADQLARARMREAQGDTREARSQRVRSQLFVARSGSGTLWPREHTRLSVAVAQTTRSCPSLPRVDQQTSYRTSEASNKPHLPRHCRLIPNADWGSTLNAGRRFHSARARALLPRSILPFLISRHPCSYTIYPGLTRERRE